mmetsp:Transcript_36803/g.62642  ORF Transcript_36803/g.62642 Transcript_36803/m.62642 type:complete len:540 (-) Transcript_36803:181-1800(-)
MADRSSSWYSYYEGGADKPAMAHHHSLSHAKARAPIFISEDDCLEDIFVTSKKDNHTGSDSRSNSHEDEAERGAGTSDDSATVSPKQSSNCGSVEETEVSSENAHVISPGPTASPLLYETIPRAEISESPPSITPLEQLHPSYGQRYYGYHLPGPINQHQLPSNHYMMYQDYPSLLRMGADYSNSQRIYSHHFRPNMSYPTLNREFNKPASMPVRGEDASAAYGIGIASDTDQMKQGHGEIYQEKEWKSGRFDKPASMSVQTEYPRSGYSIDNNINQIKQGHGRPYEEKDWKTGRVWREDDHTTTSSTSQIPSVPSHYLIPSHQFTPQLPMFDELTRHPNQIVHHHMQSPHASPIGVLQPQPLVTEGTRPGHKTISSSASIGTQAAVLEPKYKSIKKSVSFGDVQIRTHETILGDNPSCISGPPIGIGWRYDPNHISMPVDAYELSQGSKLRNDALVLDRSERETILLQHIGCNKQDLAQAVRGVVKAKSQRKKTVDNLKVAWFEERAEVLTRMLGRFVMRRERTRHMYDEWKTKSNAP